MNKKEYKNLENGLYIIFWKSGTTSLAAIGRDVVNDPWIMSTNWSLFPTLYGSSPWKRVRNVVPVLLQSQLQDYLDQKIVTPEVKEMLKLYGGIPGHPRK